ncbi:uncharacterized protein BDV14DRAFT_23588 [Aspergillus stella-maris]|uniref:uncharacterized protein n=1 Tax=Aspergillus stella-maris TaxID=1810926 RepID=UPI003CCE0CF8
MSVKPMLTRDEAAADMKPTATSQVTAPYKWDVQIEHRDGRTFRTMITVTRNTKGDDVQKLWEKIKHNLERKEKRLAALRLLGVRASAVLLSEAGYVISNDTGSVGAVVESSSDWEDFRLSTFAPFFDGLGDGHYIIHLTLFDRRPMVSTIGRAALLLLTIGLQIALAVI